jgi:predicted ATP-grasp superfamily ATP-dependent carboligase
MGKGKEELVTTKKVNDSSGKVRFIETETTTVETSVDFDELMADIENLKSQLKGKMRLYKKYLKELSHEDKKKYGGKMTEVEKIFDING